MSEKDLIFRRKVKVDRRGQARLSLPKPIAEALGDDLGLIWRSGKIVILPWPDVQEAPSS